ncbi:MAG: SH3 domain-containing protein [Desulfomonile tiedjei]|nr:SH3 domain-containing protein [Desulfomonile tiedjei]
MRTLSYSLVMSSLLAFVVVFAVAVAPALAASQDKPEAATEGITGGAQQEKKAPDVKKDVQAPEREKQMKAGEAQMEKKEGGAQKGVKEEKSREMKGQTMREGEGAMPAQKPKAETSREVKPGTSGAPTSHEFGGAKREMTREPKAGMTEQPKAGVMERGRMRTEQGREMAKPEAKAEVKGGEATVARVDRPDNCLRIRSGPSVSGNIIACLPVGESLHLTGVFSKDGRWAQLDNNGWVFVGQIKTSVALPRRAAREREEFETYESWEVPAGAGRFYRREGFEPYESYELWEVPAEAGRVHRGRGFRAYDYPYERWDVPAGAGSAYWGYSPYGYTSYYYGSPYAYYGSGCSTCGGGYGHSSFPSLGLGFGFGR